MRHKDIAPGFVHVPYNWTYPDQATREADTTVTSDDVGKLARQEDTNALYMLIATVPTWVVIGGADGTVTNNTGDLTASALIIGNGGADAKAVVGLTSDGVSRLQLGVAGGAVGGVEFRNATSGTLSLVPVTGALGTSILLVPAASGTIAILSSGVKQTFMPSSTTAGFNPGSVTGDPSGLANGDLWYDSTGNLLRARINGATVSLGGSGGTPGGSDTQIQYNNAGAFGGTAGMAYDNVNQRLAITSAASVSCVLSMATTTGTGFNNFVRFLLGGTAYGYIGIAGANDGIITGSVLGNYCLRAETMPFLFSADGGTTISLRIAATHTATFAGTIIAPTATTSIPSLRMPHGAAPSSPTNGDVWTTTAGMYARINGSTVGPFGAGGGTPGGSDTQIQYNNAGAFGGSANLTFDAATGVSSSSSASNTFTLNATSSNALLRFQLATTSKSFVGVSGASSNIITGSVSGDFCLRNESGSLLFSTDAGSTIAFKINSSGQVSAEKTTASTSVTTGALISKGGLGVADAIYVGGLISQGGGGFKLSTGATSLLSTQASNLPIEINPHGTGTLQVPKKVYFGDAINTSASTRDFNVISTTGGIALIRTGSASPFVELGSRATAASADIAFWDIYANSNSSNLDDLTFRSRVSTNDNVLRLTKTQVYVMPTTASSSITTGALRVDGGAGIAGALFTGAAITTGTPSGGTAGAWKLGILVTAAVTPDATRYIQLDVGGTLHKLIIAT